MTKLIQALLCVAGCAAAAEGQVSIYAGKDIRFESQGTAIFDNGPLAGGATYFPNIDEGGMNFRGVYSDPNNAGVFWGYAFPGGDGTPSCYFNGGANDVMGIMATDKSNLDTVELQVGAGFGGPAVYLWVQALQDGVQVASLDWDANYGDYIGITGRGYNEIRIGGYNDADTRNAHSETGYQALAVDNVSYGVIDNGEGCYADLNGDGVLDLFDFLAFTNAFNAGDDLGDCDGDGLFDLFDFLCFTNAFNAGC